MPRRITALEAIMMAGGFDYRRAEVSNVVIIRHKDGKRYGCSLDFRDALKGKEFQPFYLEPEDIIYVPRTVISKVNLWIDQYINQIIPRVGFTYSTLLGSGATIGFTPPTTVVTQP
jgi:protein involved in polysaccharide export with SLBB domain